MQALYVSECKQSPFLKAWSTYLCLAPSHLWTQMLDVMVSKWKQRKNTFETQCKPQVTRKVESQ